MSATTPTTRRARSRAPTAPGASALRPVLTPVFVALVLAALATGLGGGLQRAGVVVPAPDVAVVFHAALMLCGFLGTVIAVERAVALKHPAAFVAPLASGVAALVLLAGLPLLASTLWGLAAALFVAVNVAIVLRQPAAHTALLLFAAMAWLGGNALLLLGYDADPIVAAWFLFIVATIAAERLELTRVAPRPRHAPPLLFAILALAVAGVAVATMAPVAGALLFGAALIALALWLAVYDIARRTVFAHGLTRYMAVCLLTGYAWLAVAGACWIAYALGAPVRDVALHALGLGFIVSMVMGHAPVILPAVTGLRVAYTPAFYVPLALLHGSLLVRFAGAPWLSIGAALNAAALVLFAVTLVASVLRHRRARHAPATST